MLSAFQSYWPSPPDALNSATYGCPTQAVSVFVLTGPIAGQLITLSRRVSSTLVCPSETVILSGPSGSFYGVPMMAPPAVAAMASGRPSTVHV